MENGFNELMYQDLTDKIFRSVDSMNKDKSLLDKLMGITYKIVQKKDYDEFVHHREDIIITRGSKSERKGKKGALVVASIYINSERNGLLGFISPVKQSEKIYDAIHGFSHMYNMPTGNLL